MPEAISEREKKLKEIRGRFKRARGILEKYGWGWYYYLSGGLQSYRSDLEKPRVKNMIEHAPEDVKFLLDEISRLEKKISKTTGRGVKDAEKK